jgi:hypothetical protein
MALSIGPPVIIPFLIFGGFFLNSASVPFYFKWLSYLSWFRYGNEALLINQWADVMEGDIDCSKLNTTCPTSGKIILETLNFDEVRLFVSFMIWRICIDLKIRHNPQKNKFVYFFLKPFILEGNTRGVDLETPIKY